MGLLDGSARICRGESPPSSPKSSVGIVQGFGRDAGLLRACDLRLVVTGTAVQGSRTQDTSVEEEEVKPMDLKPEVEDSCKPRCVKQLVSFEACVKHFESDEKGQKQCTGQYFDYWGCIDRCEDENFEFLELAS